MLRGLLGRDKKERARDQANDLQYRAVAVPSAVLTAVDRQRREQVLAGAQDDDTGDWVVITTWRLVVIGAQAPGAAPDDVGVRAAREWYDVDSGTWDPDTGVLSVTWVEGTRGVQWRLRTATGPGLVPVSLRERVQSTVVLTRHVDLGPRRTARVAIRTDHRTRDLVEQVIRGRGARADDVELAEAILATRVELRDQVGMQPPA